MSQLSNLVETVVDAVTTGGADGSYDVTETETRTYAAPPALAVETTNGSVTVRGEDRDDVAVVVTKRAPDEDALRRARAVASGGGDRPLSLRAEFDGTASDVAVDFEVALPSDAPVESVETSNGSIELRDATGDARLTTTNGSITAERVDGPLDLRTRNGRVTVRECSGVDRAASTNGSVELELDALRGDATAETTSGSVTILAGPGLDADVTCTTTLGSVDAPTLSGSASSLGKSSVSGRLGEGGNRLDVETTLGSIEVRTRETGTDRRSATVEH